MRAAHGVLLVLLATSLWPGCARDIRSDGSEPHAGVHRPPTLPRWPKHASRVVDSAGETFTADSWSLALDSFDVALEDVHGTSDLAGVLRATGAVLVANGGFFDPGGAPIGLAVNGGRVLSPLSPALSGGVLSIAAGRATLAEAESYEGGAVGSFAIQCRPRLVVDAHANVKSDDGRRAERTALCVRANGHVLDVVLARSASGGPSLFAFALYLASDGCESALNLDGGPSTGAAWLEAGEVREARPRGRIRHAVVVRLARH